MKPKSKTVFSHLRPWQLAVTPLALVAMASGCSSSSLNTTPDASAPNDAASPLDGGGDGPVACARHLPSGFTNVEALPSTNKHTGYFGLQTAMALDENDDPMFAYFVGEDGGVYTLYFTRWDPCAGAFTTPLLIDTLSHGITTGGSERNVSVAYDPSTKEIGIAYNPVSPSDGNTYVFLASRKAGDAAFTTNLVSEGLSSVVGTSQPVIAMAGGQIYIAYEEGNYNCGGNGAGCQGLQLLSSTTTPPPDGGVSDDGGAPPPHYFTAQAIPYNGTPAQARPDSVSMAIDSSGNVGLAFFQVPNNYNTTLLYWRSGTAGAVAVTDTNGIQNDNVGVSLVFEGTKPRIAAKMSAAASPASAILFTSSTDGVTWAAPVPVSEDNGASNGGATLAIAMDGKGNGVITADVNGGGLCLAPYLARTTNDGTTWTACVSNIAAGTDFTLATMSAAYGHSRNAGKFILGFQNSETNLSSTDPNGVWLYQSP